MNSLTVNRSFRIAQEMSTMKQVNCEIDGTAAAFPQCQPMNQAEQGGTIRICDVPHGTPLADVLREADRMAFWHEDTTASFSSTTVEWDVIKGRIFPASEPER
jgi:hypothetical protein